VIDVARLTKRYGRTLAVDELTFTVAPGKVTGFVGPNGAGKSSTLRIILGLDHATSGHAHVHGVPYADLLRPLRRVGALLEPGAPSPGRRADHHLSWLARSNGIGRRRVGEVLDLVGLTDAARSRFGALSTGMRQRLALAAAMLGDPAVLILDEPLNGLDAAGVVWLRGLLRGLAGEGRTVLLSSHLMGEMAETADHLLVISRGRLLADGPLAEVVVRHAPPGQPTLEGAFLRLTGIEGRPG
jgi:ABC-2 type transport system ATP-binding protein